VPLPRTASIIGRARAPSGTPLLGSLTSRSFWSRLVSSCTGLLTSKRRSAKAVREQLLLRYPADVLPYANTISRSVDIDHTIAYVNLDDGGPPGQTRLGNLGAHIRYHHRIKTFGGWQVCQPEPGTWLWRSPHHRIYLVNPSGTHPLGNTEFAQTIWRATADPPPAVMSEPS
jgi:hypothetical protein